MSSRLSLKFIEYTLSNGLHVILYKDYTHPIIIISVLYYIGSKNESLRRSGFAHFFEHLMFEGSSSKNIKRGDYFKIISANGGKTNAFASKDHTYYYNTLPSNKLKLALWLESERMQHARVDKKGIDIQREVIKEEKHLSYDNQPYNIAFSEQIYFLLFKKHPYKFSIIGSMEDLNAANKTYYKIFYNLFYVPNNATLTIVGDIDIREAKKCIYFYFCSIPKGTQVVRPDVKEKSIKSEIISTFYDKNSIVPAVIFTYRTPKKKDEDSYVLKIIDQLLSKGKSSRIINSVVNKLQFALYAGSILDSLEDYGVFMIYAIPNYGISLKKVLLALEKEIFLVKKEGISKKELEKEFNTLEKDVIFNNIFREGIACSLANYHVFLNNTNMINSIIDKYRSISLEDIKRVANQYLNKYQRVCLYSLPKKNYLKFVITSE